MDIENLRTSYERDGFVVVPRFLSDGELTELRVNLDRFIDQIVPRLPPEDAFYQDRSRPETLKQIHRMDVDPYFQKVAENPKWRRLAEALIDEPVTLQPPEWFNKPPGTLHPTPPHQDNFYFCLSPPNVATVWVAIDPVDDENGCLRYLPGSHLDGFRNHQSSNVVGFSQEVADYDDRDAGREVRIHLDPGDGIAHHGMTVHRAEPNRSEHRHRRAFAMVCRGESCRRDEAAFQRYSQALRRQQQGVEEPA